jgi:predicted metal-dependent peptidase
MSLDPQGANLLAAAKLWLTSPPVPGGSPTGDMPYLATALYALVAVPTDRVAAMTTDPAWRLYVNPEWLADPARTAAEVGRHLAHHVWHLLADHAGRAVDMRVTMRTADDWKQAADVTIHALVGTLPSASDGPVLLTPQTRRLPRGLSAEEYYAMLSRLPAAGGADGEAAARADPGQPDPDALPVAAPDASCGSGSDGVPRSYDLPEVAEAGGLGEFAAQAIRRRVAIEFQQSRGRGSTPGEWDRWVEQVLDPIVDWRNVLHAAVRRGLGWAHGHTDYTYSRISRRQAVAGPVILPALRRPVPRVGIVVDTSASVDDGLLAQALGEIDGVLATLGVADPQVTVLCVDAAVQTVRAVRSADAVPLAGGGGTDMGEGIRAAQELRPQVDVILVLTDGETGWPPQAAPLPVVAVLIGRSRAHLPATPAWIQRVECVR